MQDLETALMAKLEELHAATREKVGSHPLLCTGRYNLITEISQWLNYRPDGWTTVEDGIPKHNKYVHLIVENKDGSRWMLLAWLSRMPRANV